MWLSLAMRVRTRFGDDQDVTRLQGQILLQVAAVRSLPNLTGVSLTAVHAADELRPLGRELGQADLDHDVEQREALPERDRLRLDRAGPDDSI